MKILCSKSPHCPIQNVFCSLSFLALQTHPTPKLQNSAREGSFLKSPFSKFPKRMWFLSRFRLNLLKNHVPFENSAHEGGFLKSLSQITIFKSWLFRADFQKECGFWKDSSLISSETRFLLRILLVKVVFSNHHFQIWLFRADFQTECKI